MNSSTVPLICGTALAAMSAAVLSHWWSAKEFAALAHTEFPISATRAHAPEKPLAPPTAQPAPVRQATVPAADPKQKEFYEILISRMENLQNQNRDLLDQVAETNRDLMKLEFRVDTHSESFRPMPVSEEGSFTSFDEGSDPSVLPPRAEPVSLPFDE